MPKTTVKATRYIIFTRNMERMARFYSQALGLTCLEDETTWKRFDAGGIEIALHSGSPEHGRKAPKLAFHARNVEQKRKALNKQGAKFGPVSTFGALKMSNGKDPDGNPLQLSNR